MSPKATRKDIEAARTLVRQRDGHRCQMCGQSIVDRPSSIHHRVAKGMGGSALLERASNLIRLCGNGNADGCHGKAHSNPHWARNHGWIVSRSFDPAEIPVDMHDGWHTLDDLGSRTPCESPLLGEVAE
jgi:5-methylcytosine-specific restriction endonuclease McrA